MPKPFLNCSNWDASFVPARSACFAKTVQVHLLANWARLARHLDVFLFVMTLAPRCNAVPAVDPGLQRDPLELVEEVRLWIVIAVDEYPTRVRRFLVVCFQLFDHHI